MRVLLIALNKVICDYLYRILNKALVFELKTPMFLKQVISLKTVLVMIEFLFPLDGFSLQCSFFFLL